MNITANGWEIKLLGEVVEFLDHKRIPVKESDRLSRQGPYPYYGANGQVGWIDGYIFDEPLVLLAEDGGNFDSKDKPIAYKITGKSWVNNHAHALRPLSSCNIDYLHRVLSFYDVTKFITGSTRQKLRKADCEKFFIPLPPLPIQQQIAAILEKADAAREKRRQANRLTEQFLQSAFLEMFGNPATNPKGWEIVSLQELGTLERGRSKNRPRNAPELLGGPYPLIQTGEIANASGYIKEYNQTYSELGLKQSRLWPAGTLCITIAANIAKTAVLTFDACFPDSIVGFTPNAKIATEYIQHWFSFIQRSD